MISPRALFGVAVRTIGIWQLAQAAYWFFWALWKNGGGVGNPNVPIGEDIGEGIFYLVCALILLVLADHIVLMLYGPIAKISSDATDNHSANATQDESLPPAT